MTQHAAHSIVCHTTAAVVFGLVSDATAWPAFITPCEAVTELESGPDYQLVEISARIQGRLTSWQSRRQVLPDVLGVEAEMVKPMPLVESMHTSWRVFDCDDTACVLRLEHAYDVRVDVAGILPEIETGAEAQAFMAEAIARNTHAELADFKAAAEAGPRSARWRDRHARHSIVCTAEVDVVYGLIRDTGEWPRLFAACEGAAVLDRQAETEVVRIDARQAGRKVSWVTRRTCLDAIRRIDYELVVPMPFVEAMSGEWRVLPIDERRCLLAVDRRWRMAEDVTGIRDDVSTPAQAAAFVAQYIDANATAEMQAIRDYVAEPSAAQGLAVAR